MTMMDDIRLLEMRAIDFQDICNYANQKVFCCKQSGNGEFESLWGAIDPSFKMVKLDVGRYIDRGDTERWYVGENAGDYNRYDDWRLYITNNGIADAINHDTADILNTITNELDNDLMIKEKKMLHSFIKSAAMHDTRKHSVGIDAD